MGSSKDTLEMSSTRQCATTLLLLLFTFCCFVNCTGSTTAVMKIKPKNNATCMVCVKVFQGHRRLEIKCVPKSRLPLQFQHNQIEIENDRKTCSIFIRKMPVRNVLKMRKAIKTFGLRL